MGPLLSPLSTGGHLTRRVLFLKLPFVPVTMALLIDVPCLCACLFICSVRQGDVGPVGITGPQGIKGDRGDKGEMVKDNF